MLFSWKTFAIITCLTWKYVFLHNPYLISYLPFPKEPYFFPAPLRWLSWITERSLLFNHHIFNITTKESLGCFWSLPLPQALFYYSFRFNNADTVMTAFNSIRYNIWNHLAVPCQKWMDTTFETDNLPTPIPLLLKKKIVQLLSHNVQFTNRLTRFKFTASFNTLKMLVHCHALVYFPNWQCLWVKFYFPS